MDNIDLSPESLNHIKELAQKATPGPWAYTGLASSNGSYRNGHIHQEGRDGNECVIVSLNSMANPRCLEDALFISWFHPGIALAMCAEIERLREQVKALGKSLDGLCHDDTEKTLKIKSLEKEADWLARVCAAQGLEGIDEQDVQWWRDKAREAAHRAVKETK